MNFWPKCGVALGPFYGWLAAFEVHVYIQLPTIDGTACKVMKGLLLILMCAALPAFAAGKKAVDVEAQPPFAEQAEQVRLDLRSGEKYSELGTDDRSRVLSALQRIETALQSRPAPAELTPESKMAVFNDQALVNALLSKAGEESRMICQRVRAVGSNLSTTQCMTAAERRRLRENNKDELTRMQRQTVQRQPGT
ncbi:hypothetical protein VC279_15550 [Xanthomonas sp. WHRI 10064A]|uniref:hypothetical protein n=1 Tax=unclassified Xanthomonas TaxID=2643310 RepID=UPI002B23CE18|nr:MULTISPECIES: hypothetical protein [unclassified Xanthomonas]MEA9586878.1 hypothetical protein [Xanthomonas sp. WHRI 10064B]MEA9616069.1 hypothetical protein [Xanthomonas sp. WHRI 10064A]